MSQDLTFTTSVSGRGEKGLEVRGHAVTTLIAEATFVQTFFLSLTGKMPSEAEERVLNALLVAAFDHGINPASGFVPRVVASSGNDILTCMASALLALGPYHGGAISGAMGVFQEIDAYSENKEEAALWLVKKYRAEKRRVPGFGHPVYTEHDPRTQQLFSLARSAGMPIHYMNLALQVAHTLEEQTLKRLVINVDGALAALLLTLGIDSKAGDAIFGVARVAGSIAHIVEEQKSGKWVRRIAPEDIHYKP